MRRPVDRDSEVIFDQPSPGDEENYDYGAQKSLLVDHMLKDGYRFLEERTARLAGEECFCLTFADFQEADRIRISCEVPSESLFFYFAGVRADVPVFESIIEHTSKDPGVAGTLR